MVHPIEIIDKIAPDEIWGDVMGYANHYMVSNYGRVANIKELKARLLKTWVRSKKGYLSVQLFQENKGRKFYVHRLVLETFMGMPKDGSIQCNHINGIKSDNRLLNLEWCTVQYNRLHAKENFPAPKPKRLITPPIVREIRTKYETGAYTIIALADSYNLYSYAVSKLVRYITYTSDKYITSEEDNTN